MVLKTGGSRHSGIPGLAGRHIVAEQHEEDRHCLVLDGRRARHRLRIIGAGAVHPAYEFRVPADPHLSERLTALSAFVLGARPDRNFLPTPYRRHRLVRLLAILDLAERSDHDGSLLRRIAIEIFSSRAAQGRAIDWKSSSERRQAQRLLAEARSTADIGYRNLLAGHAACMTLTATG